MMEPESLTDTTNCCMVGVQGDGVVILLPPMPRQVISKKKALNLAAWLVSCADDDENSFDKLFNLIQAT